MYLQCQDLSHIATLTTRTPRLPKTGIEAHETQKFQVLCFARLLAEVREQGTVRKMKVSEIGS